MSDRNPVSEQERAVVTVREHELQLRRARENVRRAGEMLRRAIRTAEEAEGELGIAARRLDRMESPGKSATRSLTRDSVAAS
ncbi:MAG: hypothetical protein ABI587_16315 [Gemmatimonadales bacterium]